MLLSIAEDDLTRTWKSERDLERQYREAYAQAIQLTNRLTGVQMVEDELNQLQSLHAALVDRLSSVDISQNQSDIRVSPINSPITPEHPISPSLSRVAAICLAAGFGIGLIIVYVLDVLDDRFRSPEELQEQLQTNVLAMVRWHASRDDVSGIDKLQAHVSPDAVESEAFRTLRTTLAFSNSDIQRIAITSSEPSDGKTTVLANLGVAYAHAGKRTLLIDGDLRKPGLTNLFDLRSSSGLSEILRSSDNLPEMCVQRIQSTGIERLDVLPSGQRPSDPAELLSSQRLTELIAWSETIYDQILIDTPPVLAASDAAIMGRFTDGVVLVVQPRKNHRGRVLRAVQSLSNLGVHMLGVVINAVDHGSEQGYYGYDGGYGYGLGYGEAYGSEESEPEETNCRFEFEPVVKLARAIPAAERGMERQMSNCHGP